MVEKEKEIGQGVSFEELSPRLKKLLEAAEKSMKMSYNPYSGFSVGAAALTQKGKIFFGTNYETSNWRDSVCAEAAALLAANTQGYGADIVAMAVITRKGEFPTKEISFSCGSCRQMIIEAAQRSGADIQIIFSTTLKDKIRIVKISELLPLAFGLKDVMDPKTDP